MQRKLTKRNKNWLSDMLKKANRNYMYLNDWLSIKGNLSDAKMIDRHVARYGVSLVLEKAELVFSEYYSIPQISSKGKICGYVLKHKSKLDELLVREKETQ
ncbi:TPA: hypothetical protein N2Y60_003609 [Escherichia coli]|nr:hypothetical protein [Escherichia coli]